MTKTQMTKAIQGHDEAMLLVEEIKKVARQGDDAILNLIERITEAVRDDTADDIVIDLKACDYEEAAEMVKVNYLP